MNGTATLEPVEYKHIQVRPIAGTMGAEIFGVDLAKLNDEVYDEFYNAWLRHQVVVLRDQDITPDQQVDFAMRLGGIHFHPYMNGMDNHPEILEIIKEPGDKYTFGSTWHTDQMFNPQPAKATMLYAKESPSTGGDTLFANMHDAYDALSDGMKTMLADVKPWCVGDKFRRSGGSRRKDRYQGNLKMAAKVRDAGNLQTESAHPLYRTHPETGRMALYLGNHVQTLEGFNDAEAEPILDFLREHAIRPEFTCRVNWKPGTITLWDNRSVQHHAIADYSERRRMHRITIAGDTPF
jgi:taurine dioxygenase